MIANRGMYGRAFVIVAAALLLFAAVPGIASEQGDAASRADAIVPIADHHQHLLSPAAVELQNRLLPPVTLPPPLARVVRERTAGWNDWQSLAKLYTEDSVVFAGDDRGWVRGPRDVAQYLSTRFASAYSLAPVIQRGDASHAYVAGYYVRGNRAIGYFNIVWAKQRDGGWRIVSEIPTFPGPKMYEPETAADLVKMLDEAGIRRAVVLSDAYYFDSPPYALDEPLAKVRAENDWTAAQVAQFPDRLVAFCSFNPLRDHALPELSRCASSGRFVGLKLHFGTSRVNLNDPEHVRRVRAVVEAANRLRMPIIVHVRADADYGRKEATVLLERVIAAAPDVPFQIAHLWGGEQFSADALAVYADAVSSGDPRTKNLYFDLAEVGLVAEGRKPMLDAMAARIRQIGLSRVLYGSDGPAADAMSPGEEWKITRTLPLAEDEVRAIAANVAPYLR